MASFDSGATRNDSISKLDFEGFFSPLVLEAVSEYMHRNRKLTDGSYRDSDNWQKGIPLESYMKSLWRHFFSAWKSHRGYKNEEDLKTSLCAIIFNSSGYLHEIIKKEYIQDIVREENK